MNLITMQLVAMWEIKGPNDCNVWEFYKRADGKIICSNATAQSFVGEKNTIEEFRVVVEFYLRKKIVSEVYM